MPEDNQDSGAPQKEISANNTAGNTVADQPPAPSRNPLGGILLAVAAMFLISNFFGYPIASLICLATTIWATATASRMQFRNYQLGGPAGTVSTFFSCLFFWVIGFPWFLVNRAKILNNEAPKKFGSRAATSTVILMILSLIFCFIFVIFAFLVGGSVMRARERSQLIGNQVNAIFALRSYGDAQKKYRAQSGSATAPGKYLDNFRNLHYGLTNEGASLNLISKQFADAFAGPTTGSPTQGNATPVPTAYGGYLFLDDPVFSINERDSRFALIAYPEKVGVTGDDMFFIEDDGHMFQKRAVGDANGNPVLIDVSGSVLSGSPDWKYYEQYEFKSPSE